MTNIRFENLELLFFANQSTVLSVCVSKKNAYFRLLDSEKMMLMMRRFTFHNKAISASDLSTSLVCKHFPYTNCFSKQLASENMLL